VKSKPVRVFATPRQFSYAWIASFVVMLVLTAASIQYANYVDRKSNRAWCKLIVSLDDRYQNPPADSEQDVKEFAATIHDLRMQLGC